MKKKIIITLFFLVILAIAAFLYFKSGKKEQAVAFVVSKAQYGYIAKSITATGTIQPVDTVSVGAQVSGVVKNVYVDFNDLVKQGDLLAKVDPSVIEAGVEQLKANLANAQSNMNYQQDNYDRQNQLFNLGAISKADYQIALNLYNSSKSAVAGAAAQLRIAEKNLSYTNIYSPINGVVLNRNVSAGQTIASSFNAPTLFVLAKDLTKMQVRAAVDEADVGGVKAGQYVNFTVDAYPNDIFQGEVQDVLLHPSVSANVVTYTTLINVDNAAMKLKPGMTASINIYTEEDSNALLIPSKALNFKPDTSILKKYIIKKAERIRPSVNQAGARKTSGRMDSTDKAGLEKGNIIRSFVWIKRRDSLIERRILTGLNDDTNVKVVKGLLPDEDVIINIIRREIKNSTDNIQRSPFMPQMRRRQTGNVPRNQ